MPSFFIDRPIFAWVVALFICLIGAISIPLLAVAQYPIIAPPSISISTSYPGASPENLYNSVTRLIEEELNGASGILNPPRTRWARSKSSPTSSPARTPAPPRSKCRTVSSASRRGCRAP
jgi:Cu/Ag efflux pump CusA